MPPLPPREQWIAAAGSRRLGSALGIRPDDIGEGFAQYVVEPVAANVDANGVVRSFALTVAADLAVVDAVSTTLNHDREEMNGTAELNITHVDAPSGPVTVRGSVLHAASHLRMVDIELRAEDGRLLAKGRGSYAVRPRRAARRS